MERILREHLPSVEVLGLDDVAAYDEPVEDQPTFEGNALLKARAGLAATGLPSLADDSGLCVDALNGMPGVLSARWAGPPKSDDRNNELLLRPARRRPRRAARRPLHLRGRLLRARRDELVVEGRMHGRIIRETRGSGGFGYDVRLRRRRPPRPDHRGAVGRGQGRDQPPRQGAQAAGTAGGAGLLASGG